MLKIFETLWGTNELISSFDGMNVTLPNQTDLTWSPWPHCGKFRCRLFDDFDPTRPLLTRSSSEDQDPNRKGLQCVQGILNYAPNGPNDGGLIVMEGSAVLYDEFFRETRLANTEHEDAPPPEEDFKDLFLFKDDDVKWFENRGCKLVKVELGVGDFVLWDSRYVTLAPFFTSMEEANLLMMRRYSQMHYAKFPTGNQIRHADYICMTPAKFAKAEDLKLKAEIFRQWAGTTHWPHCNIRHQAKAKRDGVVDPQERDEPLEKPELTERLLQLAAVKAY